MKIFQSTPPTGINSELAADNLLPESSADRMSAILNICLGAALFAFFANLIFLLGSYKTYFYLLLLIFIISIAQQSVRFPTTRQLFLQLLRKSWPVWPALIFLTVPSAWLFSDAMHKQSTQNIVYFALIVLIGIWSLYNLGQRARSVFAYTLFALAGVAIIVNLAVNRSGIPVPRTGIYSNPHYLALTCLWAIACLFYVGRTGKYLWMRIASLVLLLPAFFLLVNTSSRPAWLALALGGIAAQFGTRGWRGLFKAMLVVIAAVIAFVLLFPVRFAERMHALIANLGQEERVELWKTGLAMLADNNFPDWLLGHGIGSFRRSFTPETESYAVLVFPHNFALEVMFDNGLVGAALILVALVWMAWSVARLCKQARAGTREPHLVFLLFSILVAHFAFCFLTVSFYSYYFLMWFALPTIVLLYLSNIHERKAPG
jgi:O-antigen ligase